MTDARADISRRGHDCFCHASQNVTWVSAIRGVLCSGLVATPYKSGRMTLIVVVLERLAAAFGSSTEVKGSRKYPTRNFREGSVACDFVVSMFSYFFPPSLSFPSNAGKQISTGIVSMRASQLRIPATPGSTPPVLPTFSRDVANLRDRRCIG